MHRNVIFAITAALVCASCTEEGAPRGARAEVRTLTANTFELVPTHDAPKGKRGDRYCLVFTRSATGVIRQLTMTRDNKSVRCEPGRPIGNVHFRIPLDEGAVKVHIFFSDQRLDAGSIAVQLYEHKGDPSFHPMDLRLPGGVVVESLGFEPSGSTEPSPTMGAEIGPTGEIRDGGSAGAELPPSVEADAGRGLTADPL